MMAQAILEVAEEEAYSCYANAVRQFNKGDEVGFFEWIDKGSKFLCELIDIDHDAGDYAKDGGDYIRLLEWFEETGRNYPIRIHSTNSIEVANMRAIIEKNDWKEIK